MPTFRHRGALIGARILLSAASSSIQSAPALSAKPQLGAVVADVRIGGTSIHHVRGGLFAEAKIGSPIPSTGSDDQGQTMTAPHVLHRDLVHSRRFLPQELMGVGALANILGNYRCQVTAADAQAIREHPARSDASTVCGNQLPSVSTLPGRVMLLRGTAAHDCLAWSTLAPA